LVGRPLRDDQEILEAARGVVDAGVDVVAVTLGDRGALVVTRSEVVRARTPSVEVRSRVGAGDSFVAGLVLGLSRGESLEAATRLASAAGTAAVIHEGTQLCRSEDVARLLSQTSTERFSLSPRSRAAPEHDATSADVVCGTEVDPSLVDFEATLDGVRYRFCSLACQREFETNPRRYAGRKEDFPPSRA
jgi:bifunctional ADP-heptose synthase (sugar kinase/adenylyltransferase)